MDMEAIAAKVQLLSDLELATLLCLIAKQHCLIETEEDLLVDVSHELALVGIPHPQPQNSRPKLIPIESDRIRRLQFIICCAISR
jgi:hypothetical protein